MCAQEKQLGDVRQVLIQSVNINFKKIDKVSIFDKLNHYFNNAIWNENADYAKAFNCFQNFLFKDNANPHDVIKVKLGNLKFCIDYPESHKHKKEIKNQRSTLKQREIIIKNRSRTYEVEVFAFIYPSYNIVNLLYCVPIKDISIDEFIYIRKVIQFDKTEIRLVKADLLKEFSLNKKYTFEAITQAILEIIIKISGYKKYRIKYILSNLKRLKVKLSSKDYIKHSLKEINTHKMMMVEVRHITGIEDYELNSDKFVEQFAPHLYGMLVCDEGFRFVPQKCALNALGKCFSSRNYFRVFTSNIGVLEVNLVGSEIHDNYKVSQYEIARGFGDKDTENTSRETEYAGLENGSLLALEKATMLHVIIDTNMKRDYFGRKKSVGKIIKNRRNMIEIINLVMSINISEMSTLTDIIMNKIGIYKYVERVRERLDIAEDDTLIIYQKWNNRLMLMLTILGLFIAAMSIDEIKIKILEVWSFLLMVINNR